VATRQPGFWKTVLTSTVIATLLSSGLSFYQINLARQDNRASIKRQTLKDLQGSLVSYVNGAKHVYSISLHRFIETREWRNHTNLEADKEVAYAATQVEAYVVQVNDAILTKHIRALQREIAIISDSRSRPVVEQAARNMGLHFGKANERVGTLLRPLLSDVPLDKESSG
jgi:hypothetical protein